MCLLNVPAKYSSGFATQTVILRGHQFSLDPPAMLERHAKNWRSEVIRRLVDSDNGVFIDVGANVGQTLLDLRSVYPDLPYVGFEPNTSCVVQLRRLIEQSSLRNCRIVPIALAAETSVVPFYRHEGSLTDQCGTIIGDLRPRRSYDVDLVPCFRFDDVSTSLGLPKIRFVKIDVEGAEFDVLLGMQECLHEYRPIVLCEVLFTDENADLANQDHKKQMLMALLNDIGFGVFQVIKEGERSEAFQINKVKSFTSMYWTHENAALCDYLFVPREQEERVAELLSK